MSPARLGWYCLLLLALARAAAAQDDPGFQAASAVLPQGFEQTVYKGLVGNVLDVIPMEASDRLDLQRTNAVVSNTLLGRSLAVLAGLSNPAFMVGGLVWGLWAASNIKPEKAGSRLAADSVRSVGLAAVQGSPVALHDPLTAIDDTFGGAGPEPVRLSSYSRVIKIWLPQRSPALPR